ncbi:hypothetical protein LCL98_23920 [Rossellomorea aquimaris]|nr:hypothetical protein [Rossellomorea aquimaris]
MYVAGNMRKWLCGRGEFGVEGGLSGESGIYQRSGDFISEIRDISAKW